MRINNCDMCDGQSGILGCLGNIVYLKCFCCGWIQPRHVADVMETVEDEDTLISLEIEEEQA